MYIKKVRYRTEYGESIYFGSDRGFYCESIDTTGTAARISSETIIGADGRITTGANLDGKTIPCSFAFYDEFGSALLRDKIVRMFSPLVNADLEVTGQNGTYVLSGAPDAVPSVKREPDNPDIWRWSINFRSDSAYWRRLPEKNIEITGTGQIITMTNTTGILLPMIIELYDTAYMIRNDTTGIQFTAQTDEGEVTIINTDNGKIVDQNGNNVNYRVSGDVFNFNLIPGNNRIIVSGSVGGRARLRWYELVNGVI